MRVVVSSSSKKISASMRPLLAFVAARLAAVRADPCGVPLPVFNSLLSAVASADPSHSHLPLHFFRCLLLPRRRPDAFTLSSLASSFLQLVSSRSHAAASLHAFSLRLGLLHADPVLTNSILLLYLRLSDSISTALHLFDDMPVRTASTYNTLISYSPADADIWPFVRHMVADGLTPDRFTLSALLSSRMSDHHSRELHCFAIKAGMCSDIDFHVSSGIVSMYCRVRQPRLARRVFDRMQRRNVVSWTAMVGGYAENGMFEDAVNAFQSMWFIDAVLPNRIALISVLSVCNGLMGLTQGKKVHGFALRKGLYGEMSLNNALIDMYAKGGALRYARRVFDDNTWRKDIISWGSMLLGYGLHGMGAQAVALFHHMHAYGVKPDSIIVLGVLSACCRAGLVLKGLQIYNSLLKDHKVQPTEEMSACVVDLLGRSGLVDQALDFIKSMSVEPGPGVWGALLDASVIHINKEAQDLACKSLLRMEQGSPSNLVLVSNLYANSGRWNIVEQVRAKIKHGTLKKTPGRSWVKPAT